METPSLLVPESEDFKLHPDGVTYARLHVVSAQLKQRNKDFLERNAIKAGAVSSGVTQDVFQAIFPTEAGAKEFLNGLLSL